MSTRFSHTVFAAMLAAILTPEWPAAGQEGQETPPSKEIVSDLLDATPFVTRSLGLQIHLPKNARVQPQKTSSGVSLVISESSDNPRWSMRIQQMASSLREPSAAAEVDDHLKSLDARQTTYELLSRRALTISGQDAHECYIEQIAANDEPYVSGWLIVSNGPGTFLVISSLTLPHILPDVQPMFDACFQTIELQTLEDRSRRTLAQMVNGQGLLERLDEQALRRLLGWRTHLRTYYPASATRDGQEREVGWATIEVYQAKRGAINPQRNEFDYDTSEHETGMMVRIIAQQVETDSEPLIYSDVEGLYWLSWDLLTEQWSIRVTRRQGEASVSSAESGLRTPPDGPTQSVLFVTKIDDGTRYTEPAQWNLPPVYLSQALRWVLPKLLSDDLEEPIEYGWYFYDFTAPSPALSRRLDRWEPVGDQWKLTTWLSTDAPATESRYDAEGELLIQKLATGAVTVPMSLEEIQRIWRTKGLLRKSEDKPARIDR